MSQQQFRLTPKHQKSFGIMAALGVVLFVVGLILSNSSFGGGGNGHGPAPAGKEHHEDKGGSHGSGDHSDAGGLMLLTSEGHSTPGHGDKTEEVSHGHGSDHMAHGTWRRAYWTAEQAIAVHHEKTVTTKSKIGASLLVGSFWWFAIALFGVFFIAVGYTANAGWYIVIKRVLENYYRFLPIAALLLLTVFFVFGKDVYEWYALSEGTDALIDGKRGFLNVAFAIITAVFLISIYSLIGHMFKKLSQSEEAMGGIEYHRKSITYSAIFLPFFGLGFSMCAFFWLMSVDPHWFSTIYGVYCFAGLFVSGMTITMFISLHLRDKGFLPNLSGDHLHDMGKFMFAFSVFWAYIWVSQYLLIWYANIPEETIYFLNRLENYKFLFAINVIINFAFPFLALMTRDAKRKADSIRSVGRVMLFGRFLDIFLLVAPGVLLAEGGFSVMMMAAGAALIIGSIFLFVVFKGFEDAPLEARSHPYFEESVHHSTGV